MAWLHRHFFLLFFAVSSDFRSSKTEKMQSITRLCFKFWTMCTSFETHQFWRPNEWISTSETKKRTKMKTNAYTLIVRQLLWPKENRKEKNTCTSREGNNGATKVSSSGYTTNFYFRMFFVHLFYFVVFLLLLDSHTFPISVAEF